MELDYMRHKPVQERVEYLNAAINRLNALDGEAQRALAALQQQPLTMENRKERAEQEGRLRGRIADIHEGIAAWRRYDEVGVDITWDNDLRDIYLPIAQGFLLRHLSVPSITRLRDELEEQLGSLATNSHGMPWRPAGRYRYIGQLGKLSWRFDGEERYLNEGEVLELTERQANSAVADRFVPEDARQTDEEQARKMAQGRPWRPSQVARA